MKLEKLKEIPKNTILLLITLISLFFFSLIALLMQPIEQVLKTQTGYGVMEFEFAWTAEMIQIIFNAWGPEGMALEATAVWCDFLFIPSYGFFIFGAILLVSRNLNLEKLQKIGICISFTPLMAGVFDVIENINLLLMISDATFISAGSPFIASLCASIKFTLLFVGIIFFFLGLVMLLIQKVKSK